VIPVPKS